MFAIPPLVRYLMRTDNQQSDISNQKTPRLSARAFSFGVILPREFLGVLMQRELLSLFLLFAIPVGAQTIALRAGHVIDPATGAVASNQMILVENGKIASIGAGTAIPKDARVVDLANEWVMPGLIDAHTHLTFSEIPGKAPFEASYLKEGSPLRALRGLHNAEIILQAGVPTVRGVGKEANYACSDLKKAFKESWFVGPTMQCAGKIIGPFGGQSANIPPEQGAFWKWEC